MITPIDDLKALLNQLSDCSQEEKSQLETIGYNVNDLQSDLYRFVHEQERMKQFRYAVESAPLPVREAICAIAYALNLDSGPDYRSSCRIALMALLGIKDYNHQDSDIAYRLSKPYER